MIMKTSIKGAVLASVFGLVSAANSALAESEPHLTGIDLSHHNEVADWSKVEAAQLAFVILKATDGMDYLDPTFVDRYSALAGTGLIRGAYHFYETNDDPTIQAKWFIKNVPLTKGDLPPIVDIERVKAPVANDLHKDFKIFLDLIEDHYGSKPIIYTGPNFWDHVMKEHLPNYPLWIAEYGAENPTLPDGWQTWTMWQFTDSHTVAGITGAIDGSRFNGGKAQIQSVLLGQD